MSEIDYSKLPDAEMWLEIAKSVGLFQLQESQTADNMEKLFGASPALAQPFATYLATLLMFAVGWGSHCTVGEIAEKHPELLDKVPTPSEVMARAFKLLTETEEEVCDK